MPAAIARQLTKARFKMIEENKARITEDFEREFNMKEGDVIEFFQNNQNGGKYRRLGKILFVEKCFFNGSGGWTGFVKVQALLQGERLGNTKSIFMTVDRKSTRIKNRACTDTFIIKIS